MQANALTTLTVNQFSTSTTYGMAVWKIRWALRSSVVASKNACGGWKTTVVRPVGVVVWDQSYPDGTVNFFQEIDDYMALR